jgi:hypothetical protein
LNGRCLAVARVADFGFLTARRKKYNALPLPV